MGLRLREGRALRSAAFLGLVAIYFLAACAPTVQRAMPAPTEFDGPRFEVERERFVSFDGAQLGLSAWLPQDQEPWAVIVGLHGMNDYGNAFFPAGPWFAERGVAVYAYDARGFGRSPRRGVWAGERLMTEDLRTAINVARARHPDATLAVVGDSMGAATAIAAFGNGAPIPVDRLVLAAPAVWGWSSLPDLYALTLWVGAHTFPWRAVTPPDSALRRIIPSDNTEMLRRIGRDRLMLFTTRVDAVYGLVGLMESAAERIAELEGDVVVLYGEKDMVIPRPAAMAAVARLSDGARTIYYPDGYHMLMRDLQAEIVYADVLAFLRDADAPFPSGAAPIAPQTQANR